MWRISVNVAKKPTSVRKFCAAASEGTKPHVLDRVRGLQDGERVNTVVIGGGCIGAGLMYHLTKAGINDCILLEKGVMTCGSTWHAAGLCTLYHGGTNLRNWHQYGVDLYKTLEAETGKPVSFHTPGSIRLIEDTPDRIDEAQFQMGKSKFFPNEQYLVGVEEIAEMHPLCNLEGIWGGVYSPGDGHIDPTSLVNAFMAGAKKQRRTIHRAMSGHRIETNC